MLRIENPRTALLHGVRASIPMALAAFPFGLVYGVTAAESSISPWLGISASWIMLSGAAQLTLLGLIDNNASWSIAVGTALIINSRFALYSTALAPAFRTLPNKWRLSLPYLITDQTASLALLQFDKDHNSITRRWWFLGAGLFFASGWWVSTLIGFFAGGFLPEQLNINFAVPAMFIALLIPSIKNQPALVAACVAGVVAIATASLPNGLNVIVATFSGIAAARFATSRNSSQ